MAPAVARACGVGRRARGPSFFFFFFRQALPCRMPDLSGPAAAGLFLRPVPGREARGVGLSCRTRAGRDGRSGRPAGARTMAVGGGQPHGRADGLLRDARRPIGRERPPATGLPWTRAGAPAPGHGRGTGLYENWAAV